MHPHEPGMAAHLAVLHQRAADIGLDVDLDRLAAVRADHLVLAGV